jgi:hypothetical protein
MLPLALLPMIASTAVAAGKGVYDAADGPRRRRIAQQRYKKDALIDLLRQRAQQGGASTYSVDAQQGMQSNQRKLNQTPAGQLPATDGSSATFDPTAFLPLVTQGAGLAGGIYDAAQGTPATRASSAADNWAASQAGATPQGGTFGDSGNAAGAGNAIEAERLQRINKYGRSGGVY